jgi:ABC-type uncharacterized transport system fused permease/ATPase subunit
MNNREDIEPHLVWHRLVRICQPYWRAQKKSAVTLLVIATALMFGSSSISYFAGQMAGKAMTLMQRQDVNQWTIITVYCAALALSYMVSTVGFEYLRTKLANDSFEWTVTNLCQRWFHNGVVAQAKKDERLKSPEQVMTQTVEDFFNGLVGLSMAFGSYLFDLIMGMIQLFVIAAILPLEAAAWSAVGIVIVYFVGRSLVTLNEQKGEKDGALRTVITNLNEADADLDEAQELSQSLDALAQVMVVRRRMMIVNRNVSIFSYPFNQWTVILGTIVIAPFYFQHLFNGAPAMEIGVVTTVGLAFVKSVNSMTMLLQQFGGIAQWLGTIQRLGLFCEVLNEYENRCEPKLSIMSRLMGRLACLALPKK